MDDPSLEAAVLAIVAKFGFAPRANRSIYLTVHVFEGREVIITGVDDTHELKRIDGQLGGGVHRLALTDDGSQWTTCDCLIGRDHAPSTAPY